MIDVSVLIGGTDKDHDLILNGTVIRELLLRAGFTAHLKMGFERFSEDWDPPSQVFVVYAMEPYITEANQKALAKLIENGMGMVVLHSSNVMPKDMRSIKYPYNWLCLVGSRFKWHPEFGRFTVHICKSHPITKGLGDFEIEDELYILEWTNVPSCVLAVAYLKGKAQPIIYIRKHGIGRICYIALGHDLRALGHPAYRCLLIQATIWTAQKKK